MSDRVEPVETSTGWWAVQSVPRTPDVLVVISAADRLQAELEREDCHCLARSSD